VAILDATDREIIRMIQDDPSIPQRAIARAVGLSQPSVSARVQRLRRSGVLRVHAGVDPKTVDLLLAKIDVTTTDPPGLVDAFRGCPLLVNAFMTLGGSSVALLMVGESVENLESLVDMHIRPLPGVREVDFQIVTRTTRPLVLPLQLEARCETSVCGFKCNACRYYSENLCMGCPASVHYKGRFWSNSDPADASAGISRAARTAPA